MKIKFAENSMKKWRIRYISSVSENVYLNREMRNRRINNPYVSIPNDIWHLLHLLP